MACFSILLVTLRLLYLLRRHVNISVLRNVIDHKSGIVEKVEECCFLYNFSHYISYLSRCLR